jgi:hypothetical protein
MDAPVSDCNRSSEEVALLQRLKRRRQQTRETVVVPESIQPLREMSVVQLLRGYADTQTNRAVEGWLLRCQANVRVARVGLAVYAIMIGDTTGVINVLGWREDAQRLQKFATTVSWLAYCVLLHS